MAQVDIKSRKSETIVGLIILLVLGGVASWVYHRQFHYDPALFIPVLSKEAKTPSQTSGGADSSMLQPYLPDGLSPLSPIEVFGPENLSEKINGKAELYLSAGFVKLYCQRFVKAGKVDSWVEVFIYDMGSMRNSFSVYSSQRRAGSIKADFTRFAYHSRNALFFVHGQEYVEIVSASEQMLAEMLTFGENFVGRRKAQTGEVSEIALFPAAGLEEESITLLSADVFGFQGLNDVFIASYSVDGRRMTLFLSARKNPQEAEALASSYEQFLMENGGVKKESGGEVPGLRVIEILDSFELIFSHDRYFAGVHEADDRGAAVGLALGLHKALNEVTK